MGKYDDLIGSVEMKVSVKEVLDEQAAEKVDKQVKKHKKKLEEPIKPKLDLSEVNKQYDALEKRHEAFENERRRLDSKFSSEMANNDKEAAKQTFRELERVEKQIKKNQKEQQKLHSDAIAYQKELKVQRGKSKKKTEEEKDADKFIERSKTPRPRKPKAKASDSGDVAAAKKETQANEDLAESVENVDKAKKKTRAAKPKKSEAAEIKEEAKANEELAGSVDAVVKSKKKAKVTTPKVDEAGVAKKQTKANENLAKSHEKVANAIERTAEEQKKLDDLNRLAGNHQDWLKYLDRALDKSKFESSGKRDATDKLRSATNYLVTQRKESYKNANGEYAKEMAEVMWMHAYQEAEKQGVAQSVLSKYNTDARSNYESNLNTLQEVRDYRQKGLEDTLKQIEENDKLANSYKQVEKAAQAAGEAEQKRAKALNMESAIKRYNKLMNEIAREHLTIGTRFSEDTDGWNIRDMVSEAQAQLNTYYEDGHSNAMMRDGESDERKAWKSETGKLQRFIAAFEPFIEGLNTTVNHLSKYDNTLRPKDHAISQLSSLADKAKSTDDVVELSKILEARRQIVGISEDEALFDQQTLQTERAINEEIKTRINLQRQASNIVYHAGDLSDPSRTLKSLPLGNVAPSRDVGNVFNGFTGLYTTEDVDGFWANEWDGAPISSIDLSHYKMFDARDNDLAQKAQQFFGDLNSTIYGYFRFFDFNSGEMQTSADVKTVEALYDDFKAVFKGIELDFDSFKNFVVKSKAIVEGHKFEEVDVPDIDMGVAKSNAGTVLQGISQDVFNSDSFQTQLLKMLGFEGMDLRGTKFNGTYTGGTVVFDVKPESVKTVNEKWSDVMARNGYEITEESLVREEKRRQLAFETAKAYSKQTEEQERKAAVIAQETQKFTQAMQQFTPERGWVPGTTEAETYADLLMDISEGKIATAEEAMEQYTKRTKEAREAQENLNTEISETSVVSERTSDASESTKWIDEIRTKADALGDEFKDSQQYKDFFAAIEDGSINASNAVQKLEQAFEELNVNKSFDSAETIEDSIKPIALSAGELSNAFNKVDLQSFFKSLNIAEDDAKQLQNSFAELLSLYKQYEVSDFDQEISNAISQKMIALVDNVMRSGSVKDSSGINTYDDMYKDFTSYMKGKKIQYDNSDKAEFGDDWSVLRERFQRFLVKGGKGKGLEADVIYKELNELFPYLFPEDVANKHDQLALILDTLGKSADAYTSRGKSFNSLQDSDRPAIVSQVTDIIDNMWNAISTGNNVSDGVEVETTALSDLKEQAVEAADAKKKVADANSEVGASAVDSAEKIAAETEAMKEAEEEAEKVWTTPRDQIKERDNKNLPEELLKGLNLPTEFVGEDGQSVVQMFAKIKDELEEATGSPVKIDFVSQVNDNGELEAVGATLEYVNKESGVTIKQFYDIAKGEDDVITATQTAERATIKATKAQKEFNAELKKQLALEQINTLKKQMGEFPVDLTAAYVAANKIVDKESFDEFNLQLKIAQESLRGMKAEMKGQNTLDPIVAAEKRLKSLGSELDSLKNKFILISGAGTDTKWIDGKTKSIMDLYDKFNKETDADKKTGYYKQIIEELDKADNGMVNLNELIRIQNKLFKDRKALSKMDKDTQSYKVLENSVNLQGQELSNLIRNSEHRETIMKRAIQFEKELAAATQDRIDKQEKKFDSRYSGSTLLASGDWDGATEQKEAMKKFAEATFGGELAIKGFNKAGTEMYITLRDSEGALNEVTVALDKSSKKIKAFETGSNGIADAFKQLGKGAMSYVKQFTGMYLGMHDFIRYAQQGIQIVRDIDLAMTELRKVTDETEATYAKFLDTASKSAGSIGSTVKDFTTVTSDFARLGYSIEEASELAKTALIYENVGDGFNSVEEASESIISTMKAFGIEAEGTMGIVDRFNAVGNNFAITSKGIGDALQRSASALVEGGNSIDEAIGIITAANSVIQNPEQVGTAMKTLSLRLRSTKIELEEMGEDAEGAATSVASLRAKLLGLTSGKVDIMADETTFKNTTQILREMAAVWDEMDDISKAGALELMGGKRQANILSSIIANFDTVEDVIKTSANSAGSALEENRKYIESIQGHIDVLTNSWQTMWNNALNSDLIKFFIDLANILVQTVDKVGLLQVAFGAIASILTFKSFNGEEVGLFAELLKKIPVVNTLLTTFTGKLAATEISTKAAATATGLFGSALVGAATLGIALAIPLVLKLGDAFITTKKEIREAAKEAEDAIKTIKTEIDSTEDVVKNSAKRFAELSQGVKLLDGTNLSLTTDEYEEFLDLSNQLADTFPTLSRVYDENGNAIVQLSGDTNTVVDSLYDLLEVERQLANQKIADELPDLFAGIKLNSDEYGKELKDLKKQKSENEAVLEYLNGDGSNFINQLLNSSTSTIDKNDGFANVRKQLLDELGLGYSTWNRGSDVIYKLDASVSDEDIAKAKDHIALAFSEVSKEYAKNIDSLSSDIQTTVNKNKANWSGVLSSISAWLTTDESYQVLNDDTQTVVKSMINNIDFSSMDNIKTWDDMQKYIQKEIITKMQSATPEVQKAFSEMFNIDDEQSLKNYKKAIEDKAQEIETLSGGKFKANDVLQSTGYKDTLEQYETYVNDIVRILDDNLDEKELNKIKSKIYSLSPKEMSKALNIAKNYGVDTWHELKDALDNKTFDVAIDFDVEAEGLEKLQTALDETVSASGLSSEAIGNIKSRYQDLDSYDPVTLFEETANGIHLNVKAARELEAEYEKLNKEALDNKLDGLVEQYDNLSEEIANTSDAYKRAELYSKRSNILKQINDTATLAARYEGLTSAYNKWQKAQAGPEERDMYEGILEGKKAVDEEIARGWLDAGTREYIELLSGKDLSTASFNEILEIYKKLNETIAGTKYNVYDFFTKDADDNATVDGIYNFFDAVMAVQEKGKEWVKQNEDGSLSFDFSVNGGEEAVAEALGISEELVQIVLRAAADAGFDINLESAYTDLANLKDEATAANDKLKELGATDYTFNINSTDIYDVNKQIEKAKEALDQFKNTDGTINVEAEGAKEAKTLLATLIYQKQTLDDAIILKMDVENPDTELERVVKKLQDFKAAYNKLEVALAIGEDTTEANKEVQSAISALQAESPSVRATLGIDLLQSHEEINKQIGNITPEMLLKVDPDTTLVDEYKAAEHTTEGELVWHNNLKEVTDWINDPTKDKKATGYVTWYSDTSKLGTPTGGGAVANGTAHVRGTAFARGNWGAPKSETALVGELGPEMVVRGNQWFTVGENGAEFTDVKKGDIIFNHKQTEDLLSKGYINGRGKAYASGTAYRYAEGTGFTIKKTNSTTYSDAKKEHIAAKTVVVNSDAVTTNSKYYNAGFDQGYNMMHGSSGSGPGKKSSDELKGAGTNAGTGTGAGAGTKDDSKQLIDFIEMKLENIEATISKTAAHLNNYVDDTSAESDKLAQYDKLVSEEKKKKNTYSDAGSYYTQKANELLNKVNSKYRDMAQNGAIAIEDFVGESEGRQAEAIQEYREMVNKANEAKVAELEATARIEEIRLEQFNDLADDYDNRISLIESESDLINAQMDLREAQGERLSAKYYEELINNTNETISELEDKRNRMQKDLADAVASGEVKKGSDTWYEMVNAIADVDEELIQCEIDTEEFQNSINDLKWDNLDKLIDRFDALDSELSHVFDRLTDNDDVVNDDGTWNDKGIAAMGVAAQQMELAQAKAEQYGNAIADLNKNWKKWGYSPDKYNEKLAELKENQWDSIEAYEDAKDAIVDLNKTRIDAAKDAIQKEIDAYKELIDKQKESLNAEKDENDYKKKVEEQRKNIENIERKLASLSGDTSVSAMAEKNKLQAELLEEQSKLEEIYNEESFNNKNKYLDDAYTSYEDIMNGEIEALDKTLEDEEALISQSMETVKTNADKVLAEIDGISEQYGIEISKEIIKPWEDGSNAIDSYKTKFSELTSSFTDMVDDIVKQQKRLQDAADDAAESAISKALSAINNTKNSGSGKTSGGGVKADNGTKPDAPSGTAKEPEYVEYTVQKGDTLWEIAKDATGSGSNYKDIASDNNIKDPNKIYVGQTIKIPKYAKGTLSTKNDEFAWIDEVGEELVLHADGSGKLSYLTKGTSVIPADLTEKLMKLAVDPTQTLEYSRPIVNAPHITNNEITIDASIGEVIHIDTVASEDIPNLSKVVEKQMDKYIKNLNAQMRKFAR